MVTQVPNNQDSTHFLPTADWDSQASAPESVEPDSHTHHGRFLPGTRFGKRYRIVGLLGKGGMGEVYRADDLQLGQTVALKFLPSKLAQDESALGRLRREVRLARQISHPNVCRVYDIGEVDGQHFLSMEYVDGEDLASVLRRLGRPSKEKALEIARQLCSGLAAAHERSVLHRDLKPANVMIDGRGRVRIMDFGLAAFTEEPAGAGERGGTPAYMAPEQLTGQEATLRSDIYCLGLVLYELLTGRRAFQADSPLQLKKLHDTGGPDSLSSVVADVDPAVERVVLRCLEKEPSRRPTSALAVAAALPGGDPLAAALAAGETPSPEMVAAAGGKGRLATAVAAALVLAVLGGFVCVGALNERVALFRLAPLDKPPAVLVDRARQILADAGHTAEAADACYAFAVNAEYLDQIEKTDAGAGRWRRLSSGRPSAYQFQYRQSPQPLTPGNMPGRVQWNDPPQVVSGMASLVLDSSGRLVLLEIVPPERQEPSTPGQRPAGRGAADFAPLFEAAALDLGRFSAVEPMWNPLSHNDERAAWEGTYGEGDGRRVRVEAAGYNGRCVYFRVVEPFSKTWRTPDPQSQTTIGQGIKAVGVTLVMVMLVGAVMVARVNLRLGRGDRRSALRVGLFTFALGMLEWAFGADHVARMTDEFRMFVRGLGLSLVQGIWCGLAYLAVEPYVRRLWPNVLIAWTRLLTGKARDPLVGRDVLVGGAAGVAWALLTQLALWVPSGFHLPTGPPRTGSTTVFENARETAALFCNGDFLLHAMYCLFLLMGLLYLLRRRWLAVGAAWMLLSALTSARWLPRIAETVPATMVTVVAVQMALVYFVLIRFGLLALVAAWFFRDRLLDFPLTFDPSAWYVDVSWVVLVVLAALTLLASRTATAGMRYPALKRDDGAPHTA